MSRRLEKLTRTVRDIVSEVVQTQLSDPRICGMASVTRVKLAPDMSTAKIYLSIVGVDEQQQKLSFEGISHAKGFIQSRLAGALTTRVCPVLSFHLDDSLKKSFEISQLIDQAVAEYKPEADGDDANSQIVQDDRGSE